MLPLHWISKNQNTLMIFSLSQDCKILINHFLILNSTWDWGNYGSPLPYLKSLLPLNAHLHLLETFYFSVKYWCFIDYISCLLCIFPPSYWCKSGPKIAIMVQIMAENHQKLSWNDANWPQCWKGATLVQKKKGAKSAGSHHNIVGDDGPFWPITQLQPYTGASNKNCQSSS